ncbi:MAG: hypothetical protein NC818_07385 [Candidatus Omnitrophica bacterium]|nr:hypothetical protein [Candidatus Omnitrophota bacterium]
MENLVVEEKNPFEDIENEPQEENPFKDIEKMSFEGFVVSSAPTLPEAIKAGWYEGMATLEYGKYGSNAMWGKINDREAIEKADSARDYWLKQAASYGEFSFGKQPVKTIAKGTTSLLPYIITSQTEALKWGLVTGGILAGRAALVGQTLLPALPEEAITVPGEFLRGLGTGYSVGVIKNCVDVEGGSLYLDLIKKEIKPEVARPVAIAAGTAIGIVELWEFNVLGKPFKKLFGTQGLKNIANNPLIKNAIIKALGNYSKTLGVNIAQEEIQEVISLVSESLASVIDKNPEGLPSLTEWKNRLSETLTQSAISMSGIGIPGAVVDVATGIKKQAVVEEKPKPASLLEKAIAEEIVPVSEVEPAIPKPEIEPEVKETPQLPPISPEVKITPEKIKPDLSGISSLQKEIQALKEKQTKAEVAKNALQEIDNVRKFLKNKIAYREELSEIPPHYIAKKEGMETNEIINELRNRFNIEVNNEIGLKEYLQNLEQTHKNLIEEIEANRPGYITKKETTYLQEKIKAIETGFKEGVKLTREEIKNYQNELTDVLKEARIPSKDKGQFLTLIKNVQTQSQFQKAIDKLTEQIIALKEKAERKELITDIKDIFNRLDTKTLDIKYRDQLNAIKDRFLLKKKGLAPSTIEFIKRMQAEGEEINIPEEKLALLDKVKLEDLTTEELKSLNETTQRLYHLGKLKNKLISNIKEQNFEKVKGEIINLISKGKGLTEDTPIVRILREENKNLKDKSIEKIKDFIITNLRPQLLIDILDDFNNDGIFHKTIWEPLVKAQEMELTETHKIIEIIKDVHKNCNLAELFAKKYNIGRFKGITKDMAMFVYAHSLNEAERQHLYGTGFTDEDIQVITNFLSEDEKKAVRDMHRFYDEYQYYKIDKVYSQLEGVHLGKEDNYFPIDRLEDISYNKELEQDILERAYVRRAGVAKGFTKERVSSTKGFSELSYFKTILRNLWKVEHYKAFALAIRDVNKILNDTEIRHTIQQKYSKEFWRVLDKWVKDVAYGFDNRQTLNNVEKVIRWLRINYVTAVIGGNVLSMMKAPVSLLQGMEVAGKSNTIKALFKFFLSPLEWNKNINEKSVLMRHRTRILDRELTTLLNRHSGVGWLGKTSIKQFIGEKSILPWTIIDKITCDIVWLGAYEGAIKDGMSEQEAIDFADKTITKTQPISGALYLPDTFRGGEWQKCLTLFRNQQNQNFNLLVESILKKKEGKIRWGRFTNDMLFFVLVPAFFIGWINRKRIQEDLTEFALDVLNSGIGGILYIGSIINIFVSGYTADTPLGSLFEDIKILAQTKNMWKKLDRFMQIISKIIGIPYISIKRIISGKPLGETKEKTKIKGQLKPLF